MALKGNQKKLDKNNNNRIDAQDFKILKAEKAKGRGQGLQDEKMKPGKVKPVKAVLGLAAMGLMGAKYLKKKNKAMAMPGIGASAMIAKKQKEMLGKKRGGMSFSDKMKMVKEGKINKKTGKPTSLKALREMKGFKPGETPSQFNQRMDLRKAATKAAKSTRVGKMLLPVVGAAIAAKTYLNSKMKKNKDGTPKKKMGGGMMKKPMGYKTGRSISTRGGGVDSSIIGKIRDAGPFKPIPLGKSRLTDEDRKKIRELMQKRSSRKKALDTAKRVASTVASVASPLTAAASAGSKFAKRLKNKGSDTDKAKSMVGTSGSKNRPIKKDHSSRNPNPKTPKMMGGGMMMQRPMGYKAGKSVKAKCKLGRNKPTKMY